MPAISLPRALRGSGISPASAWRWRAQMGKRRGERRMRLEARLEVSRTMAIGAPFAAIAFTLLISSLFVAWAGAPLGRTYGLIFEGGFGSRFAWSATLTRATPLILTGLAAA